MKRTGRQTGMIVVLALTVLATARANNIRVDNVATLYQGVTADDTVYVEFDLNWENSWRNELNHDAAWVFVKFRAPGSNHWQHAYLSTNAAHHTAPGGKVDLGYIDVNGTTNAVGAFIYSDHNRTGSVTYSRTRLLWDYGQSGYSFDEGEVIDISVHAIEMVYVAETNFYVGSGGSESGCFTDGSWVTSTETMPFAITSEDAIVIGPEEGKLWGTSTDRDNNIGDGGTLPAAFPKGHAAFYCMKYSITQGQYVEFLNLLTYAQQNSRISGSPAGAPGTYAHADSRHAIHIAVSGEDPATPAVYATDNPYVACNYISWADGASYAAWAGLRPMTELEYEKACRGPVTPVANEYAWGKASIASARYTLADAGTAYESIDENYSDSDTHGNAVYNSSRPDSPDDGPLRVGIFALATSCRVRSGATYWGIMEMSGNVWERPVTVGRDDGRTFEGTHGDGSFDLPSDWPGFHGAGFRGGAWGLSTIHARASDRYRATFMHGIRARDYGWRGVRSAPAAP